MLTVFLFFYIFFYVLLPQKAYRTEQTPFTSVFLSGSDFTAESTEAIRMKCLAQGHNILMQWKYYPLFPVSGK